MSSSDKHKALLLIEVTPQSGAGASPPSAWLWTSIAAGIKEYHNCLIYTKTGLGQPNKLLAAYDPETGEKVYEAPDG